jgi:replication factor A1
MDIDDHAEELASDLGVDNAEVKADLENLVSYSVPMDEAKQSLRRKYGDGGEGGGGGPTTKDIADVSVNDSAVSVTAVVLTHGTRSIRYQGEDHVIREGALADESGRISYTAWDEFDMAPGDTVRIDNAGVREWDDHPELNLGERTSIEPADVTLDVPSEPGGDRPLAELATGDRGVNVEVRLQEIETKVIDGRDGETEILSGVLADESTRLPFTDWDPHDELEAGASVRIENAFVREFRGVPAVNISEFSTVGPLDRTVEPADAAERLAVGEAVDSGGQFDVEVAGNVLSIRDGSGLIERCPSCGRIAQNGRCRSHGDVETTDDLRTKAILDDGTGTLTVVLGRDLTAEVYGGGVDDAKDHAREAMDKEVVAERIRERLVGREFCARGQLSVDDFGANLEAETLEAVEDDPAERARASLAEVGE